VYLILAVKHFPGFTATNVPSDGKMLQQWDKNSPAAKWHHKKGDLEGPACFPHLSSIYLKKQSSQALNVLIQSGLFSAKMHYRMRVGASAVQNKLFQAAIARRADPPPVLSHSLRNLGG